MNGYYCIMGSWKLRHNEPLAPADRALQFIPLPGFDINAKCWEMDMADCDIKAQVIPLAIGLVLEDTCKLISFIHNIRRDKCLFMKWDSGEEFGINHLEQKLFERFGNLYLHFNNHECFYTKPDHINECETRIDAPQTHSSYWRLGIKYFNQLSAAKFPLLKIQYGKTYEHFRYHSDEYEYARSENETAKYCIMDYAAKRKSWNCTRYTIEERLYDSNNEAVKYKRQWEQETSTHNQTGVLLGKESYDEGMIKIMCESVYHANIFEVSFINSVSIDGVKQRKAVLISYLKSRGTFHKDTIYQDFKEVVASVHDFLENGSNY